MNQQTASKQRTEGAGTPSQPDLKARMRQLAIAPLLLPVFLYRKLISPFLAPRCRYYPTCSTYAVDALRAYGPFRGTVLAAWRVVRCNPFSDGGFDHVEDQRLFKAKPRRHTTHHEECDEHHNHHGAAA